MIARLLPRLVPALLAVVVAGVVVTRAAPPPRLELVASFDDVVDLVPRAHVRVADVPVGTVSAIALGDDGRARVTMHVRPGTGLPGTVTAVLRRTSLLGERYVELRPVPGATGRLRSGTVADTAVVGDLEDLVATGSDLLGAVAADRVAQIVQVGATALGGRGAAVGGMIEDLEVTVGEYAARRHDLVRLLDASDRLLGELAAHADVNAAVLEDLARAGAVLAEEDDRLLDALDDLGELADVGQRVLAANRPSLDALVTRLRRLTAELTRIDGALDGFLRWFPRHNLHVANGFVHEQSQVWNDFIVCGVHDEPDDPARSCDPPNPGRSNDPPPAYAPDDCDLHHRGCDHPGDAEPRTGP